MNIACPRCGQFYEIELPPEELRAECGVCGDKFTVYPPVMPHRRREAWLSKRRNLPNDFHSYREFADAVPAAIRAKCFVVIGVSEPHILSKIREVSDRFSRNEIDFGTAQAEISRFLVSEGYDAENPAISNLASTARINLILRQNAAMAAAVGRYSADMEPESLERWPFWKYHARGDDRTRSSHAAYDGKIYRKTDPIWKWIFPPSDWSCHCWVEEVDEEEAAEAGGVCDGRDFPFSAPASCYAFDWEVALELIAAPCVSDVLRW